jgi:hypothetical protein
VRNSLRIGLAVLAVGAAVAGGSAFTASNTVPASVAGYGSATVSGATATNIGYTLSPDGTTITDVAITFSGDQSAQTVAAGFDTAAQQACAVGAYDATADTTVATCSGFTQSTAAATTLTVSVHQ